MKKINMSRLGGALERFTGKLYDLAIRHIDGFRHSVIEPYNESGITTLSRREPGRAWGDSTSQHHGRHQETSTEGVRARFRWR